jgi:signal transduction histidine kinase
VHLVDLDGKASFNRTGVGASESKAQSLRVDKYLLYFRSPPLREAPVEQVRNIFIDEATAILLRLLDAIRARRDGRLDDERQATGARLALLVDNLCEPAASVGLPLIATVAAPLRTMLLELAADDVPATAETFAAIERCCAFLLGVVAAAGAGERESRATRSMLAVLHAARRPLSAPVPSLPPPPPPPARPHLDAGAGAVLLHDLKSPLAIVRTTADLLLSAPEAERTGPKLEESLRRILRQADRGLKLTHEVLDRAQGEAPDKQLLLMTFDPDELLREVVLDLEARARTRQLRIRLAAAPDLLVTADRDAVARVLDNLIGNAIKHAGLGATIDVGCEPHRAVAGSQRDYAVIFRVRDDGPGIAPDLLPFIFMARTHARDASRGAGHGLGLAISKAVCEAHGGTIWAQSALGGGTTVSFLLP